jgi:hypothetical protein
MRRGACARVSCLVVLVGVCAAGCGDDLRGTDGGAMEDDGADDGDDDGDGTDDGDDDGDGTDDGTDDGGSAQCSPTELPGALADAEWDPRFTIAGLSGQDGLTPKVFDLARDPNGDVLATGYFSWLGSQPVDPMVRRQDGVWQLGRETWELPVPPAGFGAMASGPSGELALATYDPLGERSSEIWVDLGEGEGLTAIGSAQGLVRSLVWFDGSLWAGGNFLLDGGPAGLAVWNGTAWQAPPGGAPDGPVFELAHIDDSLFAGGGFTSIGGIEAEKVAEWNGTEWSAYDLPYWGVGVYSIDRGPDGTLYAGGAFADAALPGGNGGAARWTGTEWEILGGGVANPFFGGVVTDLEVHLGELYITGCFSHVNGGPADPGAIEARSLARWTGTEWQTLDDGSAGAATPWFEFAACGDEGPDAIWDVPYQRLLSDGDTLYLGGSMAGAAGVASQSLIAFADSEWIAQGSAESGVAGAVTDVAVAGPDCSLHAFGGFSHAGGEPVPGRLARFDGEWTAMGTPLPPFHVCVGLAVSDDGEDIYIGCNDQSSEVFAAHVYRLVDGAWRPVGEPHGLDSLQDLVLDRAGRLWVVGGSVGGYVARLDDDEFTVVEAGFDSLVARIAIAPDGDPQNPSLVVGGAFTQIDAAPFSRVARWDGSAWSALGEGVSSGVMAVEYGTRAIYVATADEGTPGRRILGAWDGEEWTELATPERGLPAPMGESTHTFTALREIGDQLIAVGFVWPETGGRNAFVYDGERFTSIAGGIAAISVDSVAVGEGGLWFGGPIAEVGGEAAPIPSVGIGHLRWPDP